MRGEMQKRSACKNADLLNFTICLFSKVGSVPQRHIKTMQLQLHALVSSELEEKWVLIFTLSLLQLQVEESLGLFVAPVMLRAK
jgi:hypothetical protein